MTRRERVEQVMNTHGVQVPGLCPSHTEPGECEPRKRFITDLLTALEPEREGLEKILHKYSLNVVGYSWTLKRTDRNVPTAFIDAVMAWVRGEEAARTWCEHIHWNPFLKKWCFSVHISVKEEGEVNTSWDICPVAGCHARRPG